MPVEIQLRKAQSDTNYTSDGILEWSEDEVLECAQKMVSMKKKIHQKAKENIDAKQAKDKEYYDHKHADPKVTNSSIIVESEINFMNVT